MVSASAEMASRWGMMSNFKGIVTDAPPKSGACRTFLREAAESVSRREYLCGRPADLKRALCMAGERDCEIGLPKR